MLFSHDGIHDSQTHLSTPSYFYEQLRRELSLSTRTQNPCALIKVTFNNPASKNILASDILRFSHELSQLTRNEECIGRLGINEIVIIIRDAHKNASNFIERLFQASSLTVDKTLHIGIASVFAIESEDCLAILQRLDRAPLLVKTSQ